MNTSKPTISRHIAKTLPLLLLAACLNLEGGCANTINRKQTAAKEPSFDPVPDATGNHQTSGVLGWIPATDELVITPDARDTYNWLLASYGRRLTPPRTNMDSGLRSYTNAIVEALLIDVKGSLSMPFPRTSPLWAMDSKAQDDWPTLTTLANQPPPAFNPQPAANPP